jgi:hypothetical protein
MHRQDPKDSSSQPKDQRQERKSLRSTPLTARIVTTKRHTAPIPRTATARVVEPANEEAEDSSPASGED